MTTNGKKIEDSVEQSQICGVHEETEKLLKGFSVWYVQYNSVLIEEKLLAAKFLSSFFKLCVSSYLLGAMIFEEVMSFPFLSSGAKLKAYKSPHWPEFMFTC